jgi:hypothetical protein
MLHAVSVAAAPAADVAAVQKPLSGYSIAGLSSRACRNGVPQLLDLQHPDLLGRRCTLQAHGASIACIHAIKQPYDARRSFMYGERLEMLR